MVVNRMGKRQDYIVDFPIGGVPNSVAVFENVSSKYSVEMFPINIRDKKMENEMTSPQLVVSFFSLRQERLKLRGSWFYGPRGYSCSSAI
jgi:hypothetical protein